MILSDETLNFLTNEYGPIQETINGDEYIELNYFSEYKRKNKVFRAHPNYKQEGKWYDWVMIRWGKDPNVEQSEEYINECHVRHSEEENDKKENISTHLHRFCVLLFLKMVFLIQL